jgi:hypothetical protein
MADEQSVKELTRVFVFEQRRAGRSMFVALQVQPIV